MRRVLLFAAFTIVSTGLATLLNMAEGTGAQLGNGITWALGMFAGLLLGSAVERRQWLAQRRKKGNA